jgi:hypothetical protein
MLMELKNGIKNFFKKLLGMLLASLLGLIILIGVIYYLSTTDWWNESMEIQERLDIERDATSTAEFLGSEGVELKSKLSLLFIRRQTTTNESEFETLNEEIKNTIDEINTRWFRQRAENFRQRPTWHFSAETLERFNRMPMPQPGLGFSTPPELKKEWCYSAYQTAYWETAYSHCKYHAKLNDAKAQYFLGSILENGSGVSKDTREAYVWYSIAALNDYDAAVVNLKNLSSTVNSSWITSMNQQVIRCINSNFSEC